MDKAFAPQDMAKMGQYATQLLGLNPPSESHLTQSFVDKGLPPIALSPLDARHLQVLVAASGAQKIVEFGTLFGYAACKMAEASKACGKNPQVFTFEVCTRHAQAAREYIQRMALSDCIQVYEGDGLSLADDIKDQGPFDLVFIDADKLNYPGYFQWAAKHLRKGGLVVADNTWAWGHVTDPRAAPGKRSHDLATAIAQYNALAAQHPQFMTTLLPTGEGLTVSVKIQ